MNDRTAIRLQPHHNVKRGRLISAERDGYFVVFEDPLSGGQKQVGDAVNALLEEAVKVQQQLADGHIDVRL
ncbi:MAG: hypothetical protein QGG71_18500 [Pirellulaceae bacterium]|jgi:hypothetical protein|nr:hypothetical protein [Pirellulaceae bacterium]